MKNQKFERYKSRSKSRNTEPPYREVRRKNLDRIAQAVRDAMQRAGDTPAMEEWQSICKRIDAAHATNPEYAVVVLWRLLCNFSMKPSAGDES